MTYTLRLTRLSDPPNPNDYVFLWRGFEVGRCYLRAMTGNTHQWSWTTYIGLHITRIVEGVPVAGFADTLDEAKAAFCKSFDVLIAAGAFRPNKGKA